MTNTNKTSKTYSEIYTLLIKEKPRSAWSRGVNNIAIDIVAKILEEESFSLTQTSFIDFIFRIKTSPFSSFCFSLEESFELKISAWTETKAIKAKIVLKRKDFFIRLP